MIGKSKIKINEKVIENVQTNSTKKIEHAVLA
jgi:hypothetical protein